MTQEEKQLLLKDLCARLAFGRVKCQVKVESFNEETDDYIELIDDEIVFIEPDIYNAYLYKEGTDVDISNIKPYLRPMSSMTEEEKDEFDKVLKSCNDKVFACPEKERRYKFFDAEQEDFMNAHHFDYRGLIPMGLALEAPEGMYEF